MGRPMSLAEQANGTAPTSADGAGGSDFGAEVVEVRTITPAQLQQRQNAARKHGLRANSRPELRRRAYRAGRLLTHLKTLRADEGWPLKATQIPHARAWCQMEVMATDQYAAWESEPDNEKFHQSYLATRRAQLPYSKELGLTPAAELQLATVAAAGDDFLEQLAARRAAKALKARTA